MPSPNLPLGWSLHLISRSPKKSPEPLRFWVKSTFAAALFTFDESPRRSPNWERSCPAVLCHKRLRIAVLDVYPCHVAVSLQYELAFIDQC